jgi:hypothetical protein
MKREDTDLLAREEQAGEKGWGMKEKWDIIRWYKAKEEYTEEEQENMKRKGNVTKIIG